MNPVCNEKTRDGEIARALNMERSFRRNRPAGRQQTADAASFFETAAVLRAMQLLA